MLGSWGVEVLNFDWKIVRRAIFWSWTGCPFFKQKSSQVANWVSAKLIPLPRWAKQRSGMTTALVGHTSMSQLEEDLKAMNFTQDTAFLVWPITGLFKKPWQCMKVGKSMATKKHNILSWLSWAMFNDSIAVQSLVYHILSCGSTLSTLNTIWYSVLILICVSQYIYIYMFKYQYFFYIHIYTSFS